MAAWSVQVLWICDWLNVWNCPRCLLLLLLPTRLLLPHPWSWVIQTWNESGFMPPLCTYRLNWARIPSWGWWDDWDATVLQTHDSKFEPWRSEAEHATSRSRRLPTILTFTRRYRRDREPNPELWRERQRC